MTTRFWFPSSASTSPAPVAPPALPSGWTQGGSLPAARLLARGPSSAEALTTSNVAETLTTLTNVPIARHVGPSMVAGVVFSTSDTLTAVFKTLESASTADYSLQVGIYVISADGTTVQATLYAGHTATLNATVGALGEELPTAIATRIMPSTALTAGYTTVGGDRLYIIVGYRTHNTSGTSATGSIRVGSAAASDFALTSGLTTDLNPWVELSTDILFADPVPVVTGARARLVVPRGERVSSVAPIVAAQVSPPRAARSSRRCSPRAQRGRMWAPPWTQQAVLPNPPITFNPSQRRALRGIRLLRGRRWETVRPQVNPPIVVPPALRRTLRGWLPARGSQPQPVPAQVAPATPPALVPQPALRRVLRGWPSRRGRQSQPILEQPRPIVISRIRIKPGRLKPRGSRAVPVRAQLNPPIVHIIKRPVPLRGWLRRAGRIVWPVQPGAAPPPVTPGQMYPRDATGATLGPRDGTGTRMDQGSGSGPQMQPHDLTSSTMSGRAS